MDGQVASEARPLRERVALALGWRHDPAWCGIGTWIAPDGKMYQSPPSYDQDLNLAWGAAISLGRDVDLMFRQSRHLAKHDAYCIIGGNAPDSVLVGYGNAATAVCLAIVSYAEGVAARTVPRVQLDTSPKTE